MKNWTIIEVADDFDMLEDFQNTLNKDLYRVCKQMVKSLGRLS